MFDLELRFLGECTLRVRGALITTLARKELYLLAYLALRHGRASSRETLAAQLWPDTTDEKARYNLRRALTNVRQALGDQQHRLLSPTSQTLEIEFSQDVFCDVHAFDTAKTPAERLALYTGPLLPDCYDDWLLPERDLRMAQYQKAQEESKPKAKLGYLPTPLTGLIGRTQSLEAACGWLQRRRLVTLLGPGGAGKTRLALAVAEAVQERFDEGVYFVDLAPLSSQSGSKGVLLAVLKALRLPENTFPRTESLVGHVAEKSLLLLLDNCEHVLDDATAFCYTLLSQCPKLKVLATSRQALGLTGEQVFLVPSLALPPDEVEREKGESALLDFSAIRLFVERAVQANPEFRFNRENAELVIEICRRLDGMPLAIEMAASRMRTHALDELAAQLAEHLDILAVSNRAITPRQQTLNATIAWGYSLLTEAEQALFRGVSVFYGGWSREAAEALIPGASALLSALVEKSLITYDASKKRYGILQTLQQFGALQAEQAGESLLFRGRHLAYFRALCQQSQPHHDSFNAVTELNRIEQEHDNIRVALDFGTASSEPIYQRGALFLASFMNRFWQQRGYLREGYQWFETVLALPVASESSESEEELRDARARCTITAAMLASLLGDNQGARARAEHFLMQQRALGSALYTAAALSCLANIAHSLGDEHACLRLNQESLPFAREAKNPVWLTRVLTNTGALEIEIGESQRGYALLEEALMLARESGNQRAIAHILGFLTGVSFQQENLPKAREQALESLAINQTTGDRHGLCISLNYVSRLCALEQDFAQARRYRVESLQIALQIGWQEQCAALLGDFAMLDYDEGNTERAAVLCGASITQRKKLGVFPYPRKERVAVIQVALGSSAFEKLFAEGEQLSLSQAITLATEKIPGSAYSLSPEIMPE